MMRRAACKEANPLKIRASLGQKVYHKGEWYSQSQQGNCMTFSRVSP